MNIKDIAYLRYENIQDDKIVYYRAKTRNTAKAHLKPITVYLSQFAKSIIEKYGAKEANPKSLVFGIITDNDSDYQKHKKVKNFTRFINQHLKRLAEAENLPKEISTYWARHTYATHAIRKGASMEFVSEALNHSNMKVTQNYFEGFEDASKKEFADKLMDFE